MNYFKIYFFFILVNLNSFFFVYPVHAEVDANPSFLLSLDDAVVTAIKENPEIKAAIIEEEISVMDILIEEAKFGYNFSAALRNDQSLKQPSTTLTSEKQNNSALSAAIDKRFISGETLKVSLDNNRSSGSFGLKSSEFLSSGISFSLIKPLLKNSGEEANSTRIKISQVNNNIAGFALKERIDNIILETIESYFDLLFFQKNLEVSLKLRNSAEKILEITEEKINLGLIPPIEELVVTTEISRREADIISNRRDADNARDRLSKILGTDKNFTPSDDFSKEPAAIIEAEVIDRALKNNRQTIEKTLEIKNAGYILDEAENGLKPELDLQASIGLHGTGDVSWSKTVNDMISTDFYSWGIGAVFSTPLERTAETAAFRKADLNISKLRYELDALKKENEIKIKEAVRDVKTNFEKIKTISRTMELASKQFEIDTERYNLGLINTDDLLKTEESMFEAEQSYLNALNEYNKALYRLYKEEGIFEDMFKIFLN